jgi:hypothetical protein
MLQLNVSHLHLMFKPNTYRYTVAYSLKDAAEFAQLPVYKSATLTKVRPRS